MMRHLQIPLLIRLALVLGVVKFQGWELAFFFLVLHGLPDGILSSLDLLLPKGKGFLEVLPGFAFWVLQVPDSVRGGKEQSIHFMQHYQDLLGIIGLEVSLEDTEECREPCGKVEKGLP
jgi:hypothetical protein